MSNLPVAVTVLTYTHDIAPNDQKQRAAWFTKFGQQSVGQKATTVGASYDTWHKAGCLIERDGSIKLGQDARAAIHEAIVNIGRESGAIPEVLDDALTAKILSHVATTVQTLIAETKDEDFSLTFNGVKVPYSVREYEHLIPASRVEAIKATLKAEAERKKAADDARLAKNRQDTEEREARDAAFKQAAREEVSGILAQCADLTVLGRFKENLLPRAEIIEAILNVVVGDKASLSSVGIVGTMDDLLQGGQEYTQQNAKSLDSLTWAAYKLLSAKLKEREAAYPHLSIEVIPVQNKVVCNREGDTYVSAIEVTITAHGIVTAQESYVTSAAKL
jgi:hypothetical protein